MPITLNGTQTYIPQRNFVPTQYVQMLIIYKYQPFLLLCNQICSHHVPLELASHATQLMKNKWHFILVFHVMHMGPICIYQRLRLIIEMPQVILICSQKLGEQNYVANYFLQKHKHWMDLAMACGSQAPLVRNEIKKWLD